MTMHNVFSRVGGRSIEDNKIEYCELLERSNKITNLARQEKRNLNEPEMATVESLAVEMMALSAEREKLEKDESRRAAAEQALNDGSIAVPNFGQGIGGSSSAAWQKDSKGGKYAVLAKGDKASKLYGNHDANNFGHYIIARLFGVNDSTPEVVASALTGDRNDLGGFLVNPGLFAGIVDMVRARTVMGQAGMTTVLMETDSLRIPKLESDPVMALRGENDLINESNPTFGSLNLVAKNAGCLVRLSRELVEDSPMMMAQEIGNILVRSLASTIDKWALNGLGGLEPEGAYISTDSEETSVGAVDWLDLSAAATHLRDLNYQPTAAVMSPKNYEALFAAESGDGVNSSRSWLGAPPSLDGMQFLQTSTNANTQILVGDFSRFLMGLRSAPLIEATQVGGEAFERHQVLIKITTRLDFGMLHKAAFRKLTGVTV